ncbi:hypothetical protein [Flavobacterium sp.]|uniref:hypothetical protein n=1 Tax=Flavobacterium sp. TaxID=239 RepID=UPI0026196CEA|nr:hypothetical protein [Flavobacterium sp.]MDG2433437.1 hypothetical protein [Flavobacterium sp.]
MKKLIKLGFLLVLLVVFYSCANDKNGGVKLLVKLVETTEDSSKVTTVFTYKGNEIVSTDNGKEHIDYTYTNGLITKVVTTKKSNQSVITSIYTYENDKLMSLKSSNKIIINFIHNSDGSVAYQNFIVDEKEQQIKKYHGILSFKGGNLSKDVRILDDTEPGIVSKNEVSYEYDSKKNPFHNVLGYDKLLNQNQLISINNSLITMVENSITNSVDDQIISSAKIYKSAFKYDDDSYPTEQITENASGHLGYLKSNYFYE